ncbi:MULTISPECIES: DUF1351 domain-containing protein [Streptococcus]|jgi:hypothetical protein|uniref:DUF1351 domain-containing protein n=1 Tax=Streptococcus TaxID=1301 RepID=UPI00076FDE0D|nr:MULTISPECIES: DUF1351 domain-containing protein [Streptococcus]KXI11956.1 hypothetical protein HMPREF3205_01533 [Streptococcus pasteurianus]MDU7847474.1 DUF1351 domain-containing protein [Streptococcus sp.]DAM71752.1 MAG TPA: Protein of unknown function (DUF1351) [Bacteriophage sp.]
MKDVTNNTLTEINVDFTPAKIDVDYESIEKQLNAIVAQYSNYKVTASTYKTDYEERTRLNKLKQALEARRKEINAVISEPYKEFKKQYDKIVKPIDEVIESITAGLNAVDEQERLLRVDVVRATFEEKCELAELDKSTFETSYNDYSLKKYFKAGKFELKQSTIDEIDNLVLAEFKAVEEFKASKETIEEQAKEYGLLPEMYIRALEDGKTLVDVLKVMKAHKDAAILRKEQEEARAKAEAERKAEIERLAQENANAQIKAYNAETGEVLESDVIIPETQNEAENGAEFENNELVTFELRLTFPGGVKQAKMFKDFLEMNGIKYEQPNMIE